MKLKRDPNSSQKAISAKNENITINIVNAKKNQVKIRSNRFPIHTFGKIAKYTMAGSVIKVAVTQSKRKPVNNVRNTVTSDHETSARCQSNNTIRKTDDMNKNHWKNAAMRANRFGKMENCRIYFFFVKFATAFRDWLKRALKQT